MLTPKEEAKKLDDLDFLRMMYIEDDILTGGHLRGRPAYKCPLLYQQYYELIRKQPNPDLGDINKGPFHLFAIIDGHRGHAVAYMIKKYLMEIIYRNKNIMVKRRYQKGL